MRRMRVVGVRIIVFGIVAIAVLGLIIYGLWNALMPAIFNLPAISFWQGLGLLILGRVLFGGFGCGGRRGWRKGRFVHGWHDLTPEERERFRRAMHPHQSDSPPESPGSVS